MRDTAVKYVDKQSNPFSLENEISKLKVSIPLTELVKNYQYKSYVAKILELYPMLDMVNVEDDQPKLLFDPAIDGQL